MANTVIKLKKSSVPSVVPGTLDYGELAINYADGKLFYKDALGSIQEISGGGGGASFSTINVDNSLIVAGAPGSVLGIHAGDNVDLNANIISDILTISANLKPAFDKANAANVLAYDTGIAANNYAGAMANAANSYAASLTPDLSPPFNKANAAYDVANAAYGKANSANVLAYDTGIGANSYTNTSTTAANNYAGVMANSANAYAASLTPDLSPPFNVANAAFDKANSANVLAYNTGIGANNYAGVMANSSNGYAVTVGASGNNYSGDMANSVNAYANVVGSAGNTYAAAVGTNANNYANLTFVKLTAGSQTITGDISITGNLFIGGNTTAVTANNLIVDDSLIYLANNNPDDLLDIGFFGSYVNTGAVHVHTGLYRDHISKQYYLFQGFDAEPDDVGNHIAPYSNNMVNAVLVADINTSNLTLGGANAIVWVKSSYDNSNAAFDKANAANVLAYDTGIGANNYAGAMANSGNVFTGTVYTAVNSAFDVINASFSRANTSAQLAFYRVTANGTNLDAASNADILTISSSNNIVLIANATNDGIQITQVPSGVTTGNYGSPTIIPTIVVDAYGRVTSASNNAIDYTTWNTGLAAETMTVTSLSDASGTISWDASTSRMANVTLSGTGRTMANPTNLKAGSYIFICKQDGVGSKTITTWGSAFKWPAAVAPTLSTTASTTDVFSFWCDGTNLYGTYIPDCR